MQYLRQSTAVNLRMGPFFTISTNLVIASLTIQKAGVFLSKAGGALAAASSNQGASDVGAPYDSNGMYNIALDATDTGTLGRLDVLVPVTALIGWVQAIRFQVIPAAVYDALVAGSGVLDSNITKILGTAMATPTVAGIPKVEVSTMDANALDATALATSAVSELVAALNNLSSSDISTLLAALNNVSPTQIQTACNAALVARAAAILPKRWHD